MKKNKNGFTIVELVIVIAVIAILAAVMIPTFTGIVKKANESAAFQEARAMMTEYIAYKSFKQEAINEPYYIKVDNGEEEGNAYYFKVEKGEIAKVSTRHNDVPIPSIVVKTDGNDDDLFPDEYQYNSNSYDPQ